MTSARSLLSDEDRALLQDIAGEEVRLDEPMSRRTTLKIGGPADALVTPTTVPMLQKVVAACSARGIPVVAIGGGSNLLVRDGGIRGVVVATRRLRGLELRPEQDQQSSTKGREVYVEAGVSTGKLLSCATKWELGGLEFLGGVPGSVGGGLIMNAGTYLGEFKDVTTTVTTVCLADATTITRTNEACGFRYRHSDIPRTEIVASATLHLPPRARADIEADVKSLRQRRKEREPHGVSNAGSTFKNPEGDYAGRLIEEAQLKGTRVGAAECSPKHANWLVNTGGATATDLLTLVEIVRSKVHEVHGVNLQMELKVIGED